MNKHPFVTAAIAGHAEHGKRTLAQCLAGTDSDSWEARKQSAADPGMTIVPFRLPSGAQIVSVVIPDHLDAEEETAEIFNRVDLALLVVATDHGVTPQTADHLRHLDHLKAQGGLTILSKADLVDQEIIHLARMELQEISEGSCLDGKPIIPFSKPDRRGLNEILAVVEEEANQVDGTSYFFTGHYKALKKRVLELATGILSQDLFKVAIRTSELLSQLDAPVDSLLLRRILAELRSEGMLIAIDGGFRLPSLSVRLPSNRGKCAEQLLEYARNLGCVTFSERTLCELHWKRFNFGEVRELLEYLRKKKKLVHLSDGRYVPSEALEEISRKVTDLILRKGRLRLQDSWEILGYGRNRAVPVFDYLDAIGITRRVEDFRVLK